MYYNEDKTFKVTIISTSMVEAKDYYEAREIIEGYLKARNIRYDSIKIEEKGE